MVEQVGKLIDDHELGRRSLGEVGQGGECCVPGCEGEPAAGYPQVLAQPRTEAGKGLGPLLLDGLVVEATALGGEATEEEGLPLTTPAAHQGQADPRAGLHGERREVRPLMLSIEEVSRPVHEVILARLCIS